MSNSGLICECGFKFAGAGEFRNCGAFITKNVLGPEYFEEIMKEKK